MRANLFTAVALACLVGAAMAEDKPAAPASEAPVKVAPSTEERLQELEEKVRKLEAAVGRLTKTRPETPKESASAAQRFMDLSSEARAKFIEEMKANREAMLTASPGERAEFVEKAMEKVRAEEQAKKTPAAPTPPEEKEPK